MDASPTTEQRAYASPQRHAPTLAEIRGWPATVDVPAAALALGLSRSHAYALARAGQFPAQVLIAGGRMRVITASLLELLSCGPERPASGHIGGVA
ncbi:MAG: helix-turn-helix domain-containing protein [Pseudonocardiales bacterium]|nr:helix-turn-helix domain-containing protein [Pseudonocardiales bacterium]